jgi:hypothetical protein
LCLLVVCLLASGITVFGNGAGGVAIRENVPANRREDLISKLRSITGLTKLKFDDAGMLNLGHQHSNGSAEARNLLGEAVDGTKAIVIEDASSRSDVAFCRVIPGRWLSADEGAKSPAFVVLIDFTDFKQIFGDAQARAAFDVGWAFLHELDHVVADSKDAEDLGSVGDCEGHINAMRRELGLPLRIDYFFTEVSLKTDPNFNSKFVRLPFESYDSQTSRNHRYWLVWDSITVGGLATTGQTAVVRAKSSSQKN